MATVPTDYTRVEIPGVASGLSVPRFQLHDRRGGGRPPMVQWICQRHLEMILYHRTEGGSSGAIWKLLQATGLARSSFHVTRQAIAFNQVTEAEFDELLAAFKTSLPNSDPLTINKVRSVTILPLATAAAVVRTFGNSPVSLAFLRAFTQPVPRAWELEEEAEALRRAGEVDLLAEDELADAAFELEEKTFASELREIAHVTQVSWLAG
jgi:hypothetical protein